MQNRAKGQNVYKGKKSIENFLNPSKSPFLPLVELPASLNPFYKDGVRIYAKLMNALPLGNIKSLPALNMLEQAHSQGELAGVNSIIENSSGNTVLSLAVLSKLYGIKNTTAIASNEVTLGKLNLLRFFGVNIVINEEPICPDPTDKNSGIYKAVNLGKRKGWFNPSQYDNPANPQAHELWTGKQIWEQTSGSVDLLCAGLGTTGTLVGTAKYLKKKNRNLKVVGVVRAANNPVPGVRTKNLLREIDFDWKSAADMVEKAGTRESFEWSLELCRLGIVAGPSSGFALQGLLQAIAKLKSQRQLTKLKGKSGKIHAVFICPDSPYPYLDEYFQYLSSANFSSIENEHLLKSSLAVPEKIFLEAETHDLSVAPLDAFRKIYASSIPEVWADLKQGSKVKLNKNIAVIDIRPGAEFEHYHLAGSKSYSYHQVLDPSKKLEAAMKGKDVYLVCEMGIKTRVLADLLRQKGFNAFSVSGGCAEWSELDLPRWRPDICSVHDTL